MQDPEGSAEPAASAPASSKAFLLPLATMLLVLGAFLLLAFSASEPKEDGFYAFQVVNIRGKLVSLSKYRGAFGQQEPNTNKEIESFARKTYGVSFPMFSKIAVIGTGANPAFKYLIESTGEEPTWNFWKYLVDPNGKAVKAWDSTVTIEEIKPYVTELVRNIILKKRDEL